MFDYSRGEPPREYITPLRVLEVRSHWTVTSLLPHYLLPVLGRVGDPSLHQPAVD